jgi:YfiH family protein
VTADCVPILLARTDGSAVAALHAGWKGTLACIVDAFAQKLPERSLQGWVAAIGPSIGACCYRVPEERIELFRQRFPHLTTEVLNQGPDHLDLPLINASELERLDIDQVDMLDECTHCTSKDSLSVYHSFRRDGATGRQTSLIALLRTS